MRIWTIITTVLMLADTSAAGAASLDFSNAAFAPAVGEATIPIGHYEFCKSYPTECGLNRIFTKAVVLTSEAWKELIAVNNRINTTVRPITDDDLYRMAEYWAYPQGAGDCEDFVLEKRRLLAQSGWPESALLIAVVRKTDGEGHAVLMVRTDRGDLVLDNLVGEIHVWNEAPYTFLKRQDQADAGDWVDLRDDRIIVVASTH